MIVFQLKATRIKLAAMDSSMKKRDVAESIIKTYENRV